ncbi:MAG: CheR family methyltransferase [Thermoanaerobaculia bacterium]
MAATLDRDLLRDVSGYIAERMGLDFPEARWPALARGLAESSEELGFADPADCARSLMKQKLSVREIETLASHLTIGETYFFREPASFDVLEREILPRLVAKRADGDRTLRLWSAGCCTGEEAYSLAISCARALPDLERWNVSILATDINPKFLAKAEAAVYTPWSFRGVPDWLRSKYFVPAPGGKLAVIPAIRSLVRFGYLNLAEDVYPSLPNHTNGMDVIFCRNVLMYFTPGHRHRVVAAMHRCLVDDGYFLVNPAEAGSWLVPTFSMESAGSVSLYRKTLRRNDGQSERNFVPFIPEPVPFVPEPVTSLPEPEPVAVAARAETPPAVVPVSTDPVEPPLLRARLLADRGRLAEALEACSEAIAAARTDPAAYFLYATICDELDRSGEAIGALGKVLYLDPDFILAHHALGGIYKRLGRARESQRHLAVALELLSAKGRDEIVPESDGMTCGRLAETVRAMAGA